MKRHSFVVAVIGLAVIFSSQKAFAEDPEQASSAVSGEVQFDQTSAGKAVQAHLTLEDFEIPGGPPARMLQDFNTVFPEADFYEEPSKEMKEQFIKKFPLWGLVIGKIEKDDQKRNRAEEFFESNGQYPTAENHGSLPIGDYLMDYLEYEKEGIAVAPQTASTDLEAEIKALFPGWSGGEITTDMKQKFEESFSATNFGSWNPLFYGDLYDDESAYSDEDVDEGLVYEEENANESYLDENWLADEVVEKAPETESAVSESAQERESSVSSAKP